MKTLQKISGWANYPIVEAEVTSPQDIEGVRRCILANEQIIARGNGKSYGDASLGHRVISTLGLREILDFDPVAGVISCQAGVLLSDLLPTIVPAGWFFHVTPGIKHITVGGAIASDVHGKNHPLKGCFSDWLVSFELITAEGDIVVCSRHQNTSLFWQTCGGMGWTGIILSACFQLQRVPSSRMRQKTIQCHSLDGLFQAMEQRRPESYAAGWIDTTSKGSRMGQGAVHLAEHLVEDTPIQWLEAPKTNIPVFAPKWLLNPMSVRAFNALYFHKNKNAEKVVTMDAYFYPLDALRNWNRLYGRRGFIQYQFCLPENNAFDGIRRLLEVVGKSPEVPFLSVLKKHGERASNAVNTFPIKGYSLALDFPRTPTIFRLVEKLDDLVWHLGGKIYLTKDACSNPKMGGINPSEFGHPKFYSALRTRISPIH